jgi:hypothetical protein
VKCLESLTGWCERQESNPLPLSRRAAFDRASDIELIHLLVVLGVKCVLTADSSFIVSGGADEFIDGACAVSLYPIDSNHHLG